MIIPLDKFEKCFIPNIWLIQIFSSLYFLIHFECLIKILEMHFYYFNPYLIRLCHVVSLTSSHFMHCQILSSLSLFLCFPVLFLLLLHGKFFLVFYFNNLEFIQYNSLYLFLLLELIFFCNIENNVSTGYFEMRACF